MRGIETKRFRLPVLVVVTAMTLAACGDSSSGGESGDLATLEETVTNQAESADVSDEEAVLAFAACMRTNGLPDFQDPLVNPDGSIDFQGGAGDGTGERGDLGAALDACEDLLGDITFTGGRGGDFDPIELEDELLLLAQCLRDNGLEADDPDISEGFGGNRDPEGAEAGTPRGPASLFGEGVDVQDPATQEIFEQCAAEVNFERPGVGAGRGGEG